MKRVRLVAVTAVTSLPPTQSGGASPAGRRATARRRRGGGEPGGPGGPRARWGTRLARAVLGIAARCDAGVRLVGLLAFLVVALALFGLTLHGVVTHRLDATDGLVSRHGRALATAQELRAALSQADAAAAAEVFAPVELLVGRGESAAELRQRYDRIKNGGLFEASVADAARDVLDLRRLDPALCAADPPWSDPAAPPPGPDGAGTRPSSGRIASSCPLDVLAGGIPVYNGMVERARANNRAGLSVGEANLRAASTMMRTEILPATEVLVARYADAVDTAYQQATGSRGEWAIVITAALAIIALVGVQLLLVRRTNRLVNPGLLLGTGCILATVTWTAVAFGTQQTRLDTAQDSGYRPMSLLARSKTLALEARVDENLSLTALGNGTRFDEHFAWVTRGLGFDVTGDRLPPEPVTRRGSLVVALDARGGAGIPAGLESDLRSWLRSRASVVALLASSPDSVVAAARGPGDAGSSVGDPRSSDTFGQAVTRTLGPGTTAFTSFLGKLDVAIDAARGRFEGDVRRAAAALRDLELAGPALVLTAIVAAAAGMWPRLREYL
ncbi:hypothetical protein CgIS1_06280 [Frankia sp. CgS1]|uniref:Secreted protein n=1 Tax=Frankia casuarinae (strain DSM 45818 / CECT 9043 / HFP020203 / CcI3) TaxID=106370 RepID=Q2J970_FRACC|nr:hypothetical protein Francci3_2814 [Frankia casuarinae]OHV48606.1 hypothetical protein CgIS1_06280 [Frankia sp. CgIS1]